MEASHDEKIQQIVACLRVNRYNGTYMLLPIQYRDDYNAAMSATSHEARMVKFNRVVRIAEETEFQRKIHACMVSCLAAAAVSVVSIHFTAIKVALSVAFVFGSGLICYRMTQPKYFEAPLPQA